MANRVGTFRLALLIGALSALGALTACDPCAGVVGCTTDPHVTIQGKLVDANSGASIRNAQIALVRKSPSPRDSVATTTDAQGNFEAELASDSGAFDVVVAPSSLPSYRVPLQLSSSTRRGEGHVLGIWVATPIFGTTAELIFRTTQQLIQGGNITFHRTGGQTIAGPGVANDAYTSTTDVGGRVLLIPGVVAHSLDDVIGDLSIDLPGGYGTTVIQNLHLTPNYVFQPRAVLRLAAGPELSWIVQIYNRATAAGVPGTTVSFHRTGGISTSPESFSATTDTSGNFRMPIVPLGAGDVIGDLTIQPPAPLHSYTATGVHIPTYDADGDHFLPGYGVGPHLPWSGALFCNGRPEPNANVLIIRTSGINVTPTTVDAISDANGQFNMNVFKPTAYGSVFVDIQVSPSPNSACLGFVLHSVELPTLDFDTANRFIAGWTMPPKH